MFHVELMGMLTLTMTVLHFKMYSEQNKKDALLEPLD